MPIGNRCVRRGREGCVRRDRDDPFQRDPGNLAWRQFRSRQFLLPLGFLLTAVDGALRSRRMCRTLLVCLLAARRLRLRRDGRDRHAPWKRGGGQRGYEQQRQSGPWPSATLDSSLRRCR